ncbi:hypothetical protein TWF730_002480 [Orbilia blumenaviensis]|uniref:Uncharacterized protein n=1 Tax=Orbilia blumenaviensis TaxID=1796055 RepID=A0AAV9UE77_9PEZI
MPRHAFYLAVRTLSRGVGIRYIHLPPRMLPASISETRRTRIIPITPNLLRFANRRAYCDDLSGNSLFSGNWANDFNDLNVPSSPTSPPSSSSTPSRNSTPSFWRQLPDYSSAFQKSQAKKGKNSDSASGVIISDTDIEMINRTAAVSAASASSFSSVVAEEVPRVVQKTVAEITEGIKFPDPDVWTDSPASGNGGDGKK